MNTTKEVLYVHKVYLNIKGLLFALAQIMILWQTDIRQAAECDWCWLGTESHIMDVLSSNGLSQ